MRDSAGTAALAAKPKPPGNLLKIVRAAIEREGRTQQGAVAEGETVRDAEQAERLALAERATTLEESLDSKQMEQQELGERIGTVGSQIEKQKRLIQLENEALAKTQKPAETAGTSAATSAEQKVADAGGAAQVPASGQHVQDPRRPPSPRRRRPR